MTWGRNLPPVKVVAGLLMFAPLLTAFWTPWRHDCWGVCTSYTQLSIGGELRSRVISQFLMLAWYLQQFLEEGGHCNILRYLKSSVSKQMKKRRINHPKSNQATKIPIFWPFWAKDILKAQNGHISVHGVCQNLNEEPFPLASWTTSATPQRGAGCPSCRSSTGPWPWC